MPVTRILEMLSIFGFAQGASVCAFLLAHRGRARAWQLGLVLTLALLSIRLLAGAAVYGGWSLHPALASAAGTICGFLYWPVLLAYLRRMAGNPAGKARVTLSFLPALAGLAIYLAVTGGTWLPPLGIERCAELHTRAGLIAMYGAAGIMLAYAAVALAYAWGNASALLLRSEAHAAWLRSLSLLSALAPVAILASLGAGILAPGLPDVFQVLDVAAEVAVTSYLLIVAMAGRHPFLLAPSPVRADAAASTRVDMAALRERLVAHMHSGRPYRNPEMRISELAAALDVPAHVLSAVINREFGSNFFDFLNGYRVEEAARLLLEPGRRQYTILSVAMEVGFASKASFNRVFKKHMGVTPSEYQRRGGIPGKRSNSH